MKKKRAKNTKFYISAYFNIQRAIFCFCMLKLAEMLNNKKYFKAIN